MISKSRIPGLSILLLIPAVALMLVLAGCGDDGGGNGGILEFFSRQEDPIENNGAITAWGGAGATPGNDGRLSIDISTVVGQYPVP